MSKDEFQLAMTPILTRWSRGYSGDQVLLIHDEVQTLSKPDFDRVVRHLLGSQRVAPMVPDFRRAVNDLGIKPQFKPSQNNYTPSVQTTEDYLYQVRENIWADNTHIFIRGPKPAFILKADHPENPLVKEDAAVRSLRISEVKKHLERKSYGKFLESNLQPAEGLRLVQFPKEVV